MDNQDLRTKYQVLTYDPDIIEAVEILERELHEKTLEDRLIGQDIVPKMAQKYYNPETGRCYKTGIPYSSPP